MVLLMALKQYLGKKILRGRYSVASAKLAHQKLSLDEARFRRQQSLDVAKKKLEIATLELQIKVEGIKAAKQRVELQSKQRPDAALSQQPEADSQ